MYFLLYLVSMQTMILQVAEVVPDIVAEVKTGLSDFIKVGMGVLGTAAVSAIAWRIDRLNRTKAQKAKEHKETVSDNIEADEKEIKAANDRASRAWKLADSLAEKLDTKYDNLLAKIDELRGEVTQAKIEAAEAARLRGIAEAARIKAETERDEYKGLLKALVLAVKTCGCNINLDRYVRALHGTDPA